MMVKKRDELVDEVVLSKQLVSYITDILRVSPGSVDVKVEYVNEIPLTIGGKHASVVSEINT